MSLRVENYQVSSINSWVFQGREQVERQSAVTYQLCEQRKLRRELVYHQSIDKNLHKNSD